MCVHVCYSIIYVYIISIITIEVRNFGLALAKLDTYLHFEKDELLNGIGNRDKPKSKPPLFVFDPVELSFLDSFCMGV